VDFVHTFVCPNPYRAHVVLKYAVDIIVADAAGVSWMVIVPEGSAASIEDVKFIMRSYPENTLRIFIQSLHRVIAQACRVIMRMKVVFKSWLVAKKKV